MDSSKTYLILGSSGLIGSNLKQLLVNKGQNVLTFDIADNLEEDLRISNNVLLEEKIKGADFVFFLAFDVGGYKYLSIQQYGFEFIHNNIKLQSNVFELLKQYGKKFIFTSTQMSAIRYLPYGTLKIVGEHYTQALKGIYVRLWNVYGKENNNEKAHVITDFIRMVKEDGVIKMITDGSEERQFLYVSDCVNCLYILAEQYDEIPRTAPLHITSFTWVSIKQVAEFISSIYNDIPIFTGRYIDDVQIHYKNEPDNFILKYWQPSVDIKQGIEAIINSL
jgi:nucleoside-diphosphate-sugar epimerase